MILITTQTPDEVVIACVVGVTVPVPGPPCGIVVKPFADGVFGGYQSASFWCDARKSASTISVCCTDVAVRPSIPSCGIVTVGATPGRGGELGVSVAVASPV